MILRECPQVKAHATIPAAQALSMVCSELTCEPVNNSVDQTLRRQIKIAGLSTTQIMRIARMSNEIFPVDFFIAGENRDRVAKDGVDVCIKIIKLARTIIDDASKRPKIHAAYEKRSNVTNGRTTTAFADVVIEELTGKSAIDDKFRTLRHKGDVSISPPSRFF